MGNASLASSATVFFFTEVFIWEYSLRGKKYSFRRQLGFEMASVAGLVALPLPTYTACMYTGCFWSMLLYTRANGGKLCLLSHRRSLQLSPQPLLPSQVLHAPSSASATDHRLSARSLHPSRTRQREPSRSLHRRPRQLFCKTLRCL
jgi:hypothetical protein